MDVSHEHVPAADEHTRETRTDGVVTWHWPPDDMPEDFGIPENELPFIEWPMWLKRLFRRGDAAP